MKDFTLAHYQKALQSLCHKEILERTDQLHRFTIELFRRWILKGEVSENPSEAGGNSEVSLRSHFEVIAIYVHQWCQLS